MNYLTLLKRHSRSKNRYKPKLTTLSPIPKFSEGTLLLGVVYTLLHIEAKLYFAHGLVETDKYFHSELQLPLGLQLAHKFQLCLPDLTQTSSFSIVVLQLQLDSHAFSFLGAHNLVAVSLVGLSLVHHVLRVSVMCVV